MHDHHREKQNSDFPVVHDLMGLGEVGIVRDTVDLNVLYDFACFYRVKKPCEQQRLVPLT